MGLLVLVALVPLLGGGALAAASSLPAFAGWGATVATVLVLGTAWGLRRGWGPWTTVGRLGLLGALAVLWLGRLLARHGEAVDAGLSAWLPDAYSSRWIGPAVLQNLAIALAIAGALAILIGHGVQKIKRGLG